MLFHGKSNRFYLTSNLHKTLKFQISISQKRLKIKTYCFLQKNNWYLFFLVHIKIPLLLSLVNWWNKVFTWHFCRFVAARAKILWGPLKRSVISGRLQLWTWAEIFASFPRRLKIALLCRNLWVRLCQCSYETSFNLWPFQKVWISFFFFKFLTSEQNSMFLD